MGEKAPTLHIDEQMNRMKSISIDESPSTESPRRNPFLESMGRRASIFAPEDMVRRMLSKRAKDEQGIINSTISRQSN